MGVRLQDEPDGAHRFTVGAGSPADGSTIAGLAELPSDAWISFVVRDGRLLSARGTTELWAGDEVVVLAESDVADELSMIFEGPGQTGS
jgi:cell volume regulation protein A